MRYLLFLVVILCVNSVLSQSLVPVAQKNIDLSDARIYRGKGSLKYLTARFSTFMPVFIEIEEDTITRGEHFRILGGLTDACFVLRDWIQTLGYISDLYPFWGPHADHRYRVKDRSVIDSDLFPHNVVNMDSIYKIARSYCDNIGFVIFVKSTGKNYTFQSYKDDQIEYSVIFVGEGQYEYGVMQDKKYYVALHEVLHQFGAMDLYYPEGKAASDTSSNLYYINSLGKAPNASIEERNFQHVFYHSIMRNRVAVDYCMRDRLADPVTRYLIGLTDTLDVRFHRLLNKNG